MDDNALQLRQYDEWQVGDTVKSFTRTAMGVECWWLEGTAGVVDEIDEYGDVLVRWSDGTYLWHMTCELYRSV